MPAPRRSIGKLRHRLEIWEPARSPDGSGGFSRSEAKVGDVWGELVPLGEMQILQYAKLEQIRSHKCQIRYRNDIEDGWYLVYDGRKFYIEAIQVVREDRNFMDLSLREGGPV